jgi:hypothetical protein
LLENWSSPYNNLKSVDIRQNHTNKIGFEDIALNKKREKSGTKPLKSKKLGFLIPMSVTIPNLKCKPYRYH